MRKLSVATGIVCLLTLSACMDTKEPEELKPLDKTERDAGEAGSTTTPQPRGTAR